MRHETAGGHLIASVARAGPGETAREALARIAAEKPGSVELLCVTDDSVRLLGVMPSQALLQVLRREHVEDLHRLAGIRRDRDTGYPQHPGLFRGPEGFRHLTPSTRKGIPP